MVRMVRALFGVHPVSCNVIKVKGKPKRQRYQLGTTSQWKKAVVTLRAGEKIAGDGSLFLQFANSLQR